MTRTEEVGVPPARRLVAWLVLAALGLAVVAVVATAVLPAWKTGDVSVPPARATPEEVARAYVDALNSHDCGTVEALATKSFASTARSWCHDVRHLDDVEIRHHLVERPQDVGYPAGHQVADVPVGFDLDWRAFHGDATQPEGPVPWGYLMVRRSADAPWRIFDNGEG